MADQKNTTEQTAPKETAQSKADQKNTAVAARPTPPENSTYEVKDKDTLEGIAKKHNTTVAQLQYRNAIKKPDHIWPGMNLNLG